MTVQKRDADHPGHYAAAAPGDGTSLFGPGGPPGSCRYGAGGPPNGSKSIAFTIRFKMAVQSAGRTACAQVVVSRPRHVGGAFSSGGKVPAQTAEKLLQLEARGQAVEIVTILVSRARCLPGSLRAGSGPMTVAQPGRAKSTEAETSLGLEFRCMPATMAKFLKVDKPYLGNR